MGKKSLILPLLIDQRYDFCDMNKVIKILKEFNDEY